MCDLLKLVGTGPPGLSLWHKVSGGQAKWTGREACPTLPVQCPAGAVSAFEIVVGLGGIGDAPGGRVVSDLLADAVRHQAEQHLLHHAAGVIEIAVRLTAG